MQVEINWRSRKGTRTAGNWDFGGIGLRPDAIMGVVLDGATSGPAGGALASHIAHNLIDWFVQTDSAVTVDSVTTQLCCIHTQRPSEFRSDSASMVIALAEDAGSVRVLHVGDCLAGRREGAVGIDWLTRPHTLANANRDMPVETIARSPLRNRLTRSFRAREFIRPDVFELSLDGEASLVLGTDGFWAALDAENQARLLAGDSLQMADDRDDCSALELTFTGGTPEPHTAGEAAENFYFATVKW